MHWRNNTRIGKLTCAVRLTTDVRKLNNGQNLLCNLAKMTISEYLQIHDAALLDAAAIIGLRGAAAASPENHFVFTEREHGDVPLVARAGWIPASRSPKDGNASSRKN